MTIDEAKTLKIGGRVVLHPDTDASTGMIDAVVDTVIWVKWDDVRDGDAELGFWTLEDDPNDTDGLAYLHREG